MVDDQPGVKVSAINTRVRFEQWAKNPTCEANTVSAVLNVPTGLVAEKLGFQNQKQQPPFAIARGLAFEKYLFQDDAKVILGAMVQQKMVEPDEAVEFLDYRHQGNLQGLSRSAERSAELSKIFLESLVLKKADTNPKLVTGITIKLAKGVMLPEATLILDCLLATWDESLDIPRWRLKVGEIKIFPDRGGYTDPSQISSARAQAGVYKHALEEWAIENKVQKSLHVDDHGFLVFTWPGSTFPVLRPNEDLRSQAQRAKDGFSRMDTVGSQVIYSNAAEYDPEQYVDWVAHSKTNFREACWEFCDLARRCQDNALEDGRAVFLGTDPSRLLGETSVSRALALMDGAEPTSEFETELVAKLLEAEGGFF
jgi:hypothetical protein